MNMAKLLIYEPPLQVLPTLACAIGLDEAVALQQLHYWINNKSCPGRVDAQGIKWIYNTYEEWKKDNFPFWSVDKIKRIFLHLEELGLVISAQLDMHKHDATKFYRIDYDRLYTMDGANLPLSNGGKSADVNKESETTTETTPSGKLPREKVLLLGKSLDWLLAHREQIDDKVFEECMGLVKAEEAERAATLAFESGLGFSGLPWNTPKFDKLRRCVIETHARAPQAFQAWAKERAREGKYSKKPSNDAIRRDPQAFADCWPSHFPVPVPAASAPEQLPDWYTKWEGAVPKPDNLPPPRIGRRE